MGFGKWLKKKITPPKSIRKFQLKKLGKGKWWKELAQDAAFIPEHQRKMKFRDLGKGEWWERTAKDIGKKAAIAGSIVYGPALLAAAPGAISGAGSAAAGAASSAAGGAGAMLQGGSTLGTLANVGKLGMGIYGAVEGAKQAKQSKKDSKVARQLAQEALEMYRKSAEDAQARYNMNSPLRDAFRFGAMNFGDPTNPFSRGGPGGMFSGFQPQYEGAGPNPTQGQNQLMNMMQKGGVFGSFAPGGGGQQNPGIGPLTTQPGGQVPPFNPGTQGNMGPGGQFLPPANAGPMMDFLAAMRGGARGGGAGRTRSMKGPGINRAQDKGRDRA